MTDEYIAMCDCPEVQERWEPKIGDWMCRKFTVFGEELDKKFWPDEKQREDIVMLHYKSSVEEYYSGCTEDGIQRIVSFKDSDARVKVTHIYLPSTDDLLGWLGDEPIRISSPAAWDPTKNRTVWCVERGKFSYRVGTFLKELLLQAWMHLDHKKEWKSGRWVK